MLCLIQTDVHAQENSNVPLRTVLTNILCVMVKFTARMVVTNPHYVLVSSVEPWTSRAINPVLNYLSFPQMKQKFSEFSKFKEADKSLKHDLGSI